jgi:hypothetical protein
LDDLHQMFELMKVYPILFSYNGRILRTDKQTDRQTAYWPPVPRVVNQQENIKLFL